MLIAGFQHPAVELDAHIHIVVYAAHGVHHGLETYHVHTGVMADGHAQQILHSLDGIVEAIPRGAPALGKGGVDLPAAGHIVDVGHGIPGDGDKIHPFIGKIHG